MSDVCDRVDAMRDSVNDEIKELCLRRVILASLSNFLADVGNACDVQLETYGADTFVVSIAIKTQQSGALVLKDTPYPYPPRPKPIVAVNGNAPVGEDAPIIETDYPTAQSTIENTLPGAIEDDAPLAIEDPAPVAIEDPAPSADPAPTRIEAPSPADDQETVGLTPASDPYTPEEEEKIRELNREGAGNAEIARALGRRAQGFHHAVTRIMSIKRTAPPMETAQDAPKGIDPAIWLHLDKVGNTKLWTPAADLELGNLMMGGAKAAHAAEQMGLGREDVDARWQQLGPNRNVRPIVVATVAALEVRTKAALV